MRRFTFNCVTRSFLVLLCPDIQEGDSLPSVRQLADTVGVNMHTVNKAYHVLKREGYISLDKRRGAVIAVDVDKLQQLEVMKEQLRIVLARGRCKNISRQEVHELVDEILTNMSCTRTGSREVEDIRRHICRFIYKAGAACA